MKCETAFRYSSNVSRTKPLHVLPAYAVAQLRRRTSVIFQFTYIIHYNNVNDIGNMYYSKYHRILLNYNLFCTVMNEKKIEEMAI